MINYRHRLTLPLFALLFAAATATSANEDSSRQLFEKIASVFLHPRCANCHSGDEQLLAGDGQYPHLPKVPRGPDGFGTTELPCSTCHGYDNSAAAPGTAGWQAAPLALGWNGMSVAELCQLILARTSDTDRLSLADYDYLLRASPTVLRAWNPGGLRSAPPLSHQEFEDTFRRWVAAGAQCE